MNSERLVLQCLQRRRPGRVLKLSYLLLFTAILFSCTSSNKLSVQDVWLDPSLSASDSFTNNSELIVVWFDKQFLGTPQSFISSQSQFAGVSRSAMRSHVVGKLKSYSEQSFNRVTKALNALEETGDVFDVSRHWIVNGFSAQVTPKGLEAIKNLEGVAKVFKKTKASSSFGPDMGPEFLPSQAAIRFSVENIGNIPWNLEKIRAPEVWQKMGVTGEGTLNIIHDSGFKLDALPIAETIYTNKGEIPGNGLDDDNNGYIDDYHGFHFDENTPNLNQPIIRRRTNIHGNLCAAIVSGTFEANSLTVIGVAPSSRWAPVIARQNVEAAIEWAIEQGADTYSMSFSIPDLAEYQVHWRKLVEHGTYAGLVFISGAGNFAAGPRYAPIPVQMRIPESIPDAVLSVAGVGQDGQRPAFSSQGPVEWNTHYYSEGQVNKPDFTTINYRVPVISPSGEMTNFANGNSMSGPHLAGIVSLMLSANPELLPWEVRDILQKTAADIAEPGFDYQSGHGFVNAYDAVTETLRRK